MTQQSFIGTVQTIEHAIQITKRDGSSTYTGTRIVYRDAQQQIKEQVITAVGLDLNPNLANDVNALQAGKTVMFTFTKNAAGFRDFISIKPYDSNAPTAPRAMPAGAPQGVTPAMRIDVGAIGPIKGNIVTNAVTLAIACSSANRHLEIEDLTDAADMLIQLHGYMDSLSLANDLEASKNRWLELAAPVQPVTEAVAVPVTAPPVQPAPVATPNFTPPPTQAQMYIQPPAGDVIQPVPVAVEPTYIAPPGVPF